MTKPFIIALFILLTILVIRLVIFYIQPIQLQDGEKVSFHTVILDDPKNNGRYQQLTVRLGNFWQSIPVTLVASKNTQLLYGSSVLVSGTISKKVLKSKSIVTAIYFPKIKAENSGFLPIFGTIRHWLIAFCEKSFSQPYSSLFLGILFGIKNTFSNPLTISFRITGVTHVIAASGMNVTLVGGFLSGVLSKLLRRQWALSGTILGIIFYTFLSGLDASIVRAAIMGVLAFGGGLVGRQYTAFYGLFLAIASMLFVDPLLLQNVGFQLSVISTLGILFVKPLIPLKGFFLDDIGTTLAAQIATLPILLSTFGTYGLLSLIVNALVLWTIPLIMIVGGIGVSVGVVFEKFGQLIVGMIFPLLWYFVGVVEYFAQFNWTVQISHFSGFLFLGYYMLLGGTIIFLRQGNKRI